MKAKNNFFITIFFGIAILLTGCFRPVGIHPENRNDRVGEMVKILDEPASDSTVMLRKNGLNAFKNGKGISLNSDSFVQNK